MYFLHTNTALNFPMELIFVTKIRCILYTAQIDVNIQGTGISCQSYIYFGAVLMFFWVLKVFHMIHNLFH